MTGLIEAASGLLNRRVFTTAFLPLLVLAAALAAVAASAFGWTRTAHWWSALDGQVRVLLASGALLALLLLAQTLAAARVPILRWHAGHWPRPLRAVPARVQRRLRDRLPPDDPLRALYSEYDDELLPTRFGNIVFGAEHHSGDRYRLDGPTAWPRLYPLLPEPVRQDFATTAADLDRSANVRVLALIFTATAVPLGCAALPWYGTLLCLAAGLLTARIAYRAMLRHGLAYAERVRSAYDVHRFALLDAAGMARPLSYGDELDRWHALCRLWTAGIDSDSARHLRYAPAPADLLQIEPTPPAPQPVPPRPPVARVPPPAAPIGTEPDQPSPDPDGRRGTPSRRERVLRFAEPAGWWAWRVGSPLVSAALVLCAAVAVPPVARAGWPRETVRAVRDLDAYAVIRAEDVKGDERKKVIGRYPLRGIDKGEPVKASELGPRIDPERLNGTSIVSVSGPALRRPAPGIEAGTTVTLVVTGIGTPTRVPDVLVLDHTGGKDAVVALAVPRDRVDELLEALTKGTAHLLLDEPTGQRAANGSRPAP